MPHEPKHHLHLKIALAQMHVAPGAKEQNLQHAREMIGRGARAGAKLVLLPEAMPLGWMDPSSRELADEIPGGESCRILSAAACEHKVYVCSGLVEKAGDKIYNAAVLVNPAGKVILHHRKLNELDMAHDCYAVGDRLGVVETELGRIGLMICADGFADGQCIARTLGYMGADLILSPSAWAVEASHDNEREPYGRLWCENYEPVARDFQLWIAGCSNLGPIESGAWAGRKCVGASLVIGPDGQKFQAPYGCEGVFIHDLTLLPRPARGTDWSARFGRPVR